MMTLYHRIYETADGEDTVTLNENDAAILKTLAERGTGTEMSTRAVRRALQYTLGLDNDQVRNSMDKLATAGYLDHIGTADAEKTRGSAPNLYRLNGAGYTFHAKGRTRELLEAVKETPSLLDGVRDDIDELRAVLEPLADQDIEELAESFELVADGLDENATPEERDAAAGELESLQDEYEKLYEEVRETQRFVVPRLWLFELEKVKEIGKEAYKSKLDKFETAFEEDAHWN